MELETDNLIPEKSWNELFSEAQDSDPFSGGINKNILVNKTIIGGTINGVSIGGNSTIGGLTMDEIIAGNNDINVKGWTSSLVFSATDYRTVAWTAGTITIADGTTYNIGANNTEAMNAGQVYYIYLDIDASITELQKSSTNSNSVGKNRILVAVAAPNTDTNSVATFQAFGGRGGVLLSVDNIAANSASFNELISNTAQIKDAIITNAKIISLGVDKLVAGTITSKAITLSFTDGEGDCYIAAGKTDFDNDESGFIMGIDDSDSNKVKFIIGTPTEYLAVLGDTFVNTLKISPYTAETGDVPLLLSGGHYTKTTSQTYTKVKEMTIGRQGNYNVYWGVYASVLAPNYCNFSLRVKKYNQSTLTYGSETEVENKQVYAGFTSNTTYNFTDLDYKDKIYVYAKCQLAPGAGESANASYFDLYVDRQNEIIPPVHNLV